MTIAERFWAKVDTSRGLFACWPYRGALNRPGGYGAFWDGRRQLGAHRYALSIAIGRELAPDEEARHSCDNPPCCNPAHLSPGSRADNAADMVQRGRASRSGYSMPGARNPRARLTAEDVAAIRASTEPNTHLAPRYGVCDAQISRIRRGVQWTTEATPHSAAAPTTGQRGEAQLGLLAGA